MSRPAPSVRMVGVADEDAHYRASVALEEVIGWFHDDGYTQADALEKCQEAVETVYDDD